MAERKSKPNYLDFGEKWTIDYIVYGSINKKTGKKEKYNVTKNQDNKFKCTCLAYMCGRSRPCKHIKHIKSYLHIGKN